MVKTDLSQKYDAARKRIVELESQLKLLQGKPEGDLHQLFFENAPGGMTILSLTGKILACNGEAAGIVGCTPADLLGKNTAPFYTMLADREYLRTLLKENQTVRNHTLQLKRIDGSTIWVSLNAKRIQYDDKTAALVSFVDITAHHHALKEIELAEIRFKTLFTISEMCHRPEAEILNFALEAITKVSASDIGYIYFLNEDETKPTFHAWSTGVIKQCSIEQDQKKCAISGVDMWTETIKRRKPIVINDYQGHPGKTGYPAGHIPIKNHVNIPVFDYDRIVMLAGVGNKATDYDAEDIRQLQLVMDGTWRIIQRKRFTEDLKAAHEELEEKVKRRTAKLEEVNQKLANLNLDLVQKDREREQAQKALVRFERIIATTPDLISLVDKNGIYHIVNDAYLQFFGKKREDIIGKSVKQLVGPKVYERVSKTCMEKALAGETVKVESWLDLPTVGKRYMAVTYHPVSMDEDGVDYISIESRDMTELKKSEEALLSLTNRLYLATDAGNIGIWEWDLSTNDLYWDHKMMELYEVKEGEFSGMYEVWRKRVHPDDIAEVEQRLNESIKQKSQFEFEFRIIHPDNSIHVIHSAGLVQTDDDGVSSRMIGINSDITEQRCMENELRKLASTDPLTGASNRRHFMNRLTDEFDRCKRYGTSLVLLSLDIDHFKKINDTYGHPAGDDILKALVARSKATLRTTDAFGRVGGEEFMAVLTQTDITAGENTAERLRQLIEQETVTTHDHSVSYTISIGITEIHKDDATIETLLKRADDALYKAKNNGRNRCEVL
nr:diguanylate cyclase [uncultured Pseudodesulfovibrio sp.]